MTKQATTAGTMAATGARRRRRHRSEIGTAALVVALAALSMTGTAAAAPTGGNAPAAKACQKDGYTSRARAESPTVAFTSSDECTAYAAEGGTLTALQPGASIVFSPVGAGPQAGLCNVNVYGTGLLPGSNLNAGPFTDDVDSAGDAHIYAALREGSTVNASGTTASGTPITAQYVVPTC